MHYRLLIKNSQKYITGKNWGIMPNGGIMHVKESELDRENVVVEVFSPASFIVEPWTGYFDSNGKKVYCGDILEMRSMFDFKSKVVWKNGAFKLIPIDPEGLEEDMGRFGILKGWAVTSNIHNVEFLEN